jgi:hypothetical protein
VDWLVDYRQHLIDKAFTLILVSEFLAPGSRGNFDGSRRTAWS